MARRQPAPAAPARPIAPRLTVQVPPDLAGLPDEPAEPLDLDVFEQWAETGEGEPCGDA